MNSTYSWIGLTLGLFVATFGLLGLLRLAFYLLMFIVGFLCMVGYHCVKKSNKVLASDDVRLLAYESSFGGIPEIFRNMEKAPKGFKYDKRLTGSSAIDELLQEIIQLFFRDYINYWYKNISNDERVLYELHQSIQKVIINFAGRTKDVAWVPFLTQRLVDDFAAHLKIFRMTRQKLECRKEENRLNNVTSVGSPEQQEQELEEMFFNIESEVEQGKCRGIVCLEDRAEMTYLQDVVEILLYLLLPPEDFQSVAYRYFLKEVIAHSVILPTVNLVCNPDYVNQTISWLLAKETTFTVDSFLTTIRFCDDIEDVEETKKKVDLEIAKLRSQDSDESSQLEISVKKQLSSLMYVRKLCVSSISRLKSGGVTDDIRHMETEPGVDLLELLTPSQNIPKLSLKEILENNTSLSYFIEYLGTYSAEHYVFFHLTVEGFRATAFKQLTLIGEEVLNFTKKHTAPKAESFNQLRQAAANIYEEYLSPRASPRILLDDQVIRKIVKDIKSDEPSGAYFDTAHMAVFKILESPKYYGSFLTSTAYLKCIDDLGLLTKAEEKNLTCSDDDASNNMSSKIFPEEEILTAPWTPECDLRYSALIGQAGVISHEGKSYVNYTVHVCRTTSNGSRNWVVMRRYSDFHDLHMQLRERFPSLTWMNLPSKKTFGNFDEDFIEKRRNQLENYLQPLLETSLLSDNSGMFELVAGFLEQGDYYAGKSLLSRKMDHIVNPMKASLSNVSRVVKSRGDTVSKWAGDLSDSFKGPKIGIEKNVNKDYAMGKLSDGLDQGDDENIPLRIMLLLMDEVFDLRNRNQWLRRQIVIILRQLLKATFGDRINRKIVDYVDFAASSQQVAEYVRHFRDSYWPGGVLAEASPERPNDVKRRMRMVTKAKMIGAMPEELKRFLGTDIVREGISRVFDMFQHVNLNKRLLYVMTEAFLETTFPDNRFCENFTKIHSKRT